jgi:hypothetical protein
MAKRILSKKPKRKQLSRKMKRKTLNRKKRGGGQTRYPGDSYRTGNSEVADESLRNICMGVLLFLVFILLPAAASAAYTSPGDNYGPYGGAKFKLPEDLKSCIVDKDKFNKFLGKVYITDNILTIDKLTDKEITKLKDDNLLKQYYIKADTTSVSFHLNKIPQTQEEIQSFIDKIRSLDSKNSLVNVDCIDKKVAEIFKEQKN